MCLRKPSSRKKISSYREKVSLFVHPSALNAISVLMGSIGYQEEQHWSHDGLPVERDTAPSNGISICLLLEIQDPDLHKSNGEKGEI